jgi:hypothetical protein
MLWFGPIAFGPVCETNQRVEIPLGETCEECDEPIVDEDFGIMICGWDDDIVFHRECFLHHLGIKP